MTLTDRKRHYNKMWARVSRAQKRKGEDTESNISGKSVREISNGTHVVNEINLGKPNTALTEIYDDEGVVGPTLREELSEWASTFYVKHNAVDALLKILQ